MPSSAIQAARGQPKEKVTRTMMMIWRRIMFILWSSSTIINSNVSWVPLAFDILAVLAQLSGALLWPLLQVMMVEMLKSLVMI